MAFNTFRVSFDFSDNSHYTVEALAVGVGLMVDMSDINGDEHIANRLRSAMDELGKHVSLDPDMPPANEVSFRGEDFRVTIRSTRAKDKSETKAEEAQEASAADMASTILSQFSTKGQTPQ